MNKNTFRACGVLEDLSFSPYGNIELVLKMIQYIKGKEKTRLIFMTLQEGGYQGKFRPGDWVEVTGHIESKSRKNKKNGQVSTTQVLVAEQVLKAKTWIESEFGIKGGCRAAHEAEFVGCLSGTILATKQSKEDGRTKKEPHMIMTVKSGETDYVMINNFVKGITVKEGDEIVLVYDVNGIQKTERNITRRFISLTVKDIAVTTKAPKKEKKAPVKAELLDSFFEDEE